MKTTKKIVIVLITAVTALIMLSCEEFSNEPILIDAPTVDEHLKVIPMNPSASPLIADIPDQTIFQGQNFCCIALDNYVSDPDNPDCEMCWRYSGNTELIVTINACRTVTIELPFEGWTGSENIWFMVTDPDRHIASDMVTFTVKEGTGDDFQRDDPRGNIAGILEPDRFDNE